MVENPSQKLDTSIADYSWYLEGPVLPMHSEPETNSLWKVNHKGVAILPDTPQIFAEDFWKTIETNHVFFPIYFCGVCVPPHRVGGF